MKLDYEGVIGIIVTFLTGKELWAYLKARQQIKEKETEREGKEIEMYRRQNVLKLEELNASLASKNKKIDELTEEKLNLSSALARAEEQIKHLEKENTRLNINTKYNEEYIKGLLNKKDDE